MVECKGSDGSLVDTDECPHSVCESTVGELDGIDGVGGTHIEAVASVTADVGHKDGLVVDGVEIDSLAVVIEHPVGIAGNLAVHYRNRDKLLRREVLGEGDVPAKLVGISAE